MTEQWRCLLCDRTEVGGLSAWLAHYQDWHQTLRPCAFHVSTRCNCVTVCGRDVW